MAFLDAGKTLFTGTVQLHQFQRFVARRLWIRGERLSLLPALPFPAMPESYGRSCATAKTPPKRRRTKPATRA